MAQDNFGNTAGDLNAAETPREKWRRRLLWMLRGGGALTLFIAIPTCGEFAANHFQVWQETARRQLFAQVCAHPTAKNAADFNRATAGQSACETFPGTVETTVFQGYHDPVSTQYWLTIGTQQVKDDNGNARSGNPEAIGYEVGRRNINNKINLPVDALFWKGKLMTISTRAGVPLGQMQTFANPTTHYLSTKSYGFSNFYCLPLFFMCGAFFGFLIGEGDHEKQQKAKRAAAAKTGVATTPEKPFREM